MTAFPNTHYELTLWELAHYLCDKSPYRFQWLPISHEVKDVIRTLLHEIHVGRLDSLLIYDKRENEKQPSPPEFYLSSHLQVIFDCIANKSYPRKLLNFITINRYAFGYWCDKAGFPKPDFWFSVSLDWDTQEHEEFEIWAGISGKPESSLDPKQKILAMKNKAITLAKTMWDTDPSLPVNAIATSEEMLALDIPRSSHSIRNWISPFRPSQNIPKVGRPKL